MDKINLEIWNDFLNIKLDKSTLQIDKPRKRQRILKELALSNKKDDLWLIAKIASRYVSKGKIARKGFNLCHPLNKGDIYNALYMDFILEELYKANTELKNKVLFELSNEHLELINYKIKTAPRLFSSEYVFENFCNDVVDYGLEIDLQIAYNIYENNISDDVERTWDIRWADFLHEKGKGHSCFPFLYNSDIETWTKFLSSIKIPIFDDSGLTKRQFRQDCRWYAEVLQVAYKNNHPKKEFYYDDWLKKGFPKDLLDKYVKTAHNMV